MYDVNYSPYNPVSYAGYGYTPASAGYYGAYDPYLWVNAVTPSPPADLDFRFMPFYTQIVSKGFFNSDEYISGSRWGKPIYNLKYLKIRRTKNPSYYLGVLQDVLNRVNTRTGMIYLNSFANKLAEYLGILTHINWEFIPKDPSASPLSSSSPSLPSSSLPPPLPSLPTTPAAPTAGPPSFPSPPAAPTAGPPSFPSPPPSSSFSPGPMSTPSPFAPPAGQPSFPVIPPSVPSPPSSLSPVIEPSLSALFSQVPQQPPYRPLYQVPTGVEPMATDLQKRMAQSYIDKWNNDIEASGDNRSLQLQLAANAVLPIYQRMFGSLPEYTQFLEDLARRNLIQLRVSQPQ
ncbi:MAG: hypothetical protein RLZ12_702 [Bacillota bacterium]|jgi:hypothetical protein